MHKLAVGAAALGAAALLLSSPAQAEQAPPSPGVLAPGSGFLYLEVDPETGSTERAVLACPSGAGHDRGEEACAHLSAAGGDLSMLAALPGMCTKEHAPVVLKGFGLWEGRFTYFEAEYGNYCEGLLATGGAVFDIVEEP